MARPRNGRDKNVGISQIVPFGKKSSGLMSTTGGRAGRLAAVAPPRTSQDRSSEPAMVHKPAPLSILTNIESQVPGGRRWADASFHPPILATVTSPRGTACGLVCLLREIPTLVVPLHIVGSIDDLPTVKAVARVPIHPVDAFGNETVSKDTASAGVHVELKMHPETLLFHSPPPSAGRSLDHDHLDYVAVAVRYPYPKERLRRLEDATEVVAPRTRVTLFAAPAEWHELSTPNDADARARRAQKYQLTSASAAACISSRGGAAAYAEVMWRPGWTTSRNALTAAEHVVVRHNATRLPSEAGALVMSASPGWNGSEPCAGPGEYWAGLRMLALQRLRAQDGEEGAGVMIADILRDVAEHEAQRIVRASVKALRMRPVVEELMRDAAGMYPGSGSRGMRCRAATEALLAVGNEPVGATAQAALMHKSSDREILTGNSPTRAENGSAHLQRDMERWTERFPLSVQLADATCHALGWLARAGIGDGDAGLGTGDALCLKLMWRHPKCGALRAKGLWALRMRLQRRLSYPAVGSDGRTGLTRMAEEAKRALEEPEEVAPGPGRSAMMNQAAMLADLCLQSVPGYPPEKPRPPIIPVDVTDRPRSYSNDTAHLL